MIELINVLEKRRKIAALVVILLTFLALAVNINFQISPVSYFDPKYNIYFVYGLIVYKILELPIIYYLLFHRYILKFRKLQNNSEYFNKLQKHTKLLFFLIPQGNIVFGIIAYKLSGDVSYFLIFSFIALLVLLLVKPKRLKSNT